MIAVLFVQQGGVYYGRTQLDLWPESHDALRYTGDHPVVVHPPCQRWCQLAHMNQAIHGYRVGDDGGTFAFALATVRRCGGVLEHPAYTYAWKPHGLTKPPRSGWLQTGPREWVCQVSQAAYGHRARKLTWLLYVGDQPPLEMDWSTPTVTAKVGGQHGRSFNKRRSPLTPLSSREACATPPRFADALLALADHSRVKQRRVTTRSCRPSSVRA